MSKDLLFSIILHLIAIGAAIVASPLEHRKKMDFGEVIKVSLKSMSEIQKSEPAPPLIIPKPQLADEVVQLPLDDPRTVKTKKEIKKPEEKPKEEKKPETQTTTPSEQPPEKEIETQSTAAGQMFAGATVHNESFDYPYWFEQAFNKISANFRNPVSSDAPIIAVVYFEVIQSGRVVDVHIVESSDVQPFDDACIRAIERSAPFPPLPKSFQDEIIGITLPFKFEPH